MHQTAPRLWVLSRTQRPHGMFLLWLRQLMSWIGAVVMTLLCWREQPGRSRSLSTPRNAWSCGPERPRGPVTNFLALPPRATGKRFGNALFSLPFAARIATPARTHARAAHAPTTDDERRNVRSAGVCSDPAWVSLGLGDVPRSRHAACRRARRGGRSRGRRRAARAGRFVRAVAALGSATPSACTTRASIVGRAVRTCAAAPPAVRDDVAASPRTSARPSSRLRARQRRSIFVGVWSSTARGPRRRAVLGGARRSRQRRRCTVRAALHSGPHSGPGRYCSALCVVYGAPRRAGAGGRSGRARCATAWPAIDHGTSIAPLPSREPQPREDATCATSASGVPALARATRLAPLHTAHVTSSHPPFDSVSPPLTHAAANARLLALTHARSRRAVAAAAAATDDARDDARGENSRVPT